MRTLFEIFFHSSGRVLCKSFLDEVWSLHIFPFRWSHILSTMFIYKHCPGIFKRLQTLWKIHARVLVSSITLWIVISHQDEIVCQTHSLCTVMQIIFENIFTYSRFIQC